MLHLIAFLATIVLELRGIDLKDIGGLHFFMASDFHLYQLVTYLFLHANFMHILSNMFGLWMFGCVIENVWGPKKFLFYYISCGIGAGLLQEIAQLGSFYMPITAQDPSVSFGRSAAYAARHIAKNMVAAGVADEMLVQISYAIGVAKPMNIYVNTYGRSHVNMTDGEIAKRIEKLFDLRPKAIERTLKLRQPMYVETAAYGHMGRQYEVKKKTFTSRYHETKTIDVELFTWEKLDRVEDIKREFAL